MLKSNSFRKIITFFSQNFTAKSVSTETIRRPGVPMVVAVEAPNGLDKADTNPYSSRPDYAFWRRAVSRIPWLFIDPVIEAPFRVTLRRRKSPVPAVALPSISPGISQARVTIIL